MGAVYAYVILLTFLGPEHLKRSFDAAHDEDLQEVTGRSNDASDGEIAPVEAKGSDEGTIEKVE